MATSPLPGTAPIALRTGDARDVAGVDALMAAAFDPRFGEAWTRSQCLGVLAMPGVRLTLAFLGPDLAGFALTRTIMDEAELLLLAVAPPHQRRGIGAALLGAILAEARGRGVVTLHLEVRAGNAAIGLYEKAGFARIGERRGYYRGGDGEARDALTYALGL